MEQPQLQVQVQQLENQLAALQLQVQNLQQVAAQQNSTWGEAWYSHGSGHEESREDEAWYLAGGDRRYNSSGWPGSSSGR